MLPICLEVRTDNDLKLVVCAYRLWQLGTTLGWLGKRKYVTASDRKSFVHDSLRLSSTILDISRVPDIRSFQHTRHEPCLLGPVGDRC